MDEREVRALAGGGAGHRDLLRAQHALVLRGVVPAALLFVAGAALPGGVPVRRLAALVFLAAAAGLAFAPLAGTGRRPFRAAVAGAAGVPLGLVAVSLVFGGATGAAAAAGGALAGWILFLAGLAAVVGGLTSRPGGGVALAGMAGAVTLASFHLGDPFIEWGGPGHFSPVAMRILQAMNPLSGAVGDALHVDWLRLPILYRGFPGSGGRGLSAASFYPFRYFPWWGTLLLYGGAGGLLLLTRRAGSGARSGA